MEVFNALFQLLEIGKGIIQTSENVGEIIGDIVGDVSRLRMSLESEKAKIDRMLMYDFSSATNEVRHQGSQTQGMFRDLCSRWRQISKELSQAVSLKQLEAWKLNDFKERISYNLSYSSSCEQSYNIFKERLVEALRIAFSLCDSLQSGAQRAKAGARKTKIGGYSAAGAMGAGAVACTVAAVFTGGLSLIGTAVLGAGAAAAATATKKHAAQLEQLASDFHQRLSSINASIRSMENLAEQVEEARMYGLSANQGLENQMQRLQLETNRRTRVGELRRNIQHLQSQLDYLEN